MALLYAEPLTPILIFLFFCEFTLLLVCIIPISKQKFNWYSQLFQDLLSCAAIPARMVAYPLLRVETAKIEKERRGDHRVLYRPMSLRTKRTEASTSATMPTARTPSISRRGRPCSSGVP